MAAGRSRCVAASTRTSTWTVRVRPTGRTSPAPRNRRSTAWASSGSSPTSSRNTVPPSASRRSPACRSTAPVNAPRSWPKSSLRRSSRLSAAAVHRLEARGPPRAQPVERRRHQLLAGARLADDQDRHVHGGDALEASEERLHGSALADEALEARQRPLARPVLGHGSRLSGGRVGETPSYPGRRVSHARLPIPHPSRDHVVRGAPAADPPQPTLRHQHAELAAGPREPGPGGPGELACRHAVRLRRELKRDRLARPGPSAAIRRSGLGEDPGDGIRRVERRGGRRRATPAPGAASPPPARPRARARCPARGGRRAGPARRPSRPRSRCRGGR